MVNKKNGKPDEFVHRHGNMSIESWRQQYFGSNKTMYEAKAWQQPTSNQLSEWFHPKTIKRLKSTSLMTSCLVKLKGVENSVLVEENLKSEIQFQESWTINNIQFQDLLNIMLQQKKML